MRWAYYTGYYGLTCSILIPGLILHFMFPSLPILISNFLIEVGSIAIFSQTLAKVWKPYGKHFRGGKGYVSKEIKN